MTIEEQIQLAGEAARLLGSQARLAEALGINDRNTRYILAGKKRLHEIHLQKISAALLDHADQCRALERKLNPAFAANRTEAQARPPLHSGKHASADVADSHPAGGMEGEARTLVQPAPSAAGRRD